MEIKPVQKVKESKTFKQLATLSKAKVPSKKKVTPFLAGLLAFAVVVSGALFYQNRSLAQDISKANTQSQSVEEMLEAAKNELEELKSQDQIKRNDDLEEEIGNIQSTYDTAVSVYESLVKLKEDTDETDDLDELFTESIVLLSEKSYASASALLKQLAGEIDKKESEIAASFTIPANVPVSNAPPGAGYSRQTVNSDAGNFLVSMVAADLGSTRVIVDTASDSDCGNECPVLSLGDYVSRNGAFAGINGTYFCPASYPSCAGKTNTFDLLVMNKNKYYFNSGNNVYSNNPAVIFGSGYIRFVSAASQWGRDTGVDGVISNFPLLVFNNNVTFGGDDDPKKGSVGSRSFVANKGNTVYIGVVHSATVAQAARALQALGMENAMNLDSGGSTALWSGGYKVGPGRNIPNAVLFVRK